MEVELIELLLEIEDLIHELEHCCKRFDRQVLHACSGYQEFCLF